LENGKEQSADGLKSATMKNIARTSATIDTRGKSSAGI